jgi:hypothetical protein
MPALPVRRPNARCYGVVITQRKGNPMKTVTNIGVDLAKSVFHVHAAEM